MARRRTSRSSMALGVALAMAFCVSAALAQATPAASQAQVYFNDAGASGPVEPRSFAPASPCCLTEYVRDLTWQSWGGATATGTGMVSTGKVTSEGNEGESPATVTLSGLSTCGGQPVYSSYTIEVASGIQPADWAQAHSGSFACRFSAGNYRPSKIDAQGGCEFQYLANGSAWTPRLPWHEVGFCRMQWQGFDVGPTTVGKGVMRNGFTQWGVKVVLSDLAWCQEGIGDAIAYTGLSMTIYGPGETENNGEHTPDDDITVANANRLRANIGRPGLKARRYRYTKPLMRGCVAL